MCDLKTACIDIETTGLTWPDQVLSVGVSYRNGDGSIHSKAWPIMAADLFHAPVSIPQIRSELIPILQNAELVIGHNLSFDLAYLFKHGIVLADEVTGKLFDTLLIGRMTGPHMSHGLADLCAELKIGTQDWRAKKSKRGNLKREPVDALLEYNQEDTTNNLLLAEAYYDLGKQYYDPAFMLRESEFCRVMAEVRVRGMELDSQKVYDRIVYLKKQKQQRLMLSLWDNRIDGPNDKTGLIRFLKAQGVQDFEYTDKGNVSLKEEVVKNMIDRMISPFPNAEDENGDVIEEESFYDPNYKRLRKRLSPKIQSIVDVLDAVLACKGWEKEINTWLIPYIEEHAIEDGKIHANYTVGGTESFRLSCSNPNLQAIPDLDIWQPYLNFDYSQAEYRLGALYAGYMTGNYDLAFGYANGLDAHTNTARILFNTDVVTKTQRHTGKTINFASNYFAGAARVAQQLGCDISEARNFLDMYRKRLAPLFTTAQKVNEQWEKRGYIKLWTGKRIWKKYTDPDYVGWNRLVQGGVAEIAKEAMFELDRRGVPLLGQVHDSVKTPLDVDIEEVQDAMFNALPEEIRKWTTPQIDMLVDYEIKGEVKDE